MGKSLLDIIAENERNRIKHKNLDIPTDDVAKSAFQGYSSDYGLFKGIDYTKDKNKTALTVNEVGDRALGDLKDLNIFPQNSYTRLDTDLNDASVIDMPSIDEISKHIYLNNISYNKFSSLLYVPYEVEDAIGYISRNESYGEYIRKIQQKLSIFDILIPDIAKGITFFVDSSIGAIGRFATLANIKLQAEAISKRETLGLVTANPYSVLQNNSFTRPDYSITVPPTIDKDDNESNSGKGKKGNKGKKTTLPIFVLPSSYLPKDIFGLERTRIVDNGRVSYIGDSMTDDERIQLLLSFTGKGQQQHLFNQMKLNLYHPQMAGVLETLESNKYINYLGLNIRNIYAREFTVTLGNSTDSGVGYYEPYGIVSIHKLSKTGKMISDQFAWNWMSDIRNDDAIGWTKSKSIPLVGDTPITNKFNPKSLLFKTQELVLSNPNAFLDMNDKQFVESINGDNLTISRGDSTTASGLYVDDDGEIIESGEYFRVWTKKRGYNRLSRTLRHRGLDNGDIRSVLNDNGLVNFAPTLRTASKANNLEFDDVIKRYMFSIENLAWNDNMNDLPYCEQGAGDPVTGTRGRIMWFPPYNLKIEENISANWKDTSFLGRGEPLWTYNNTTRSATLNWTIIVDHPDIVHNIVAEKTEYWERYFKGDKLIQDDAKAKQQINKKLSQNEIDEIDKQRKLLKPFVKKDDEPVISKDKKNDDDDTSLRERIKNGEFGRLVNKIYFPNESVHVPVPAIIYTNGSTSGKVLNSGIIYHNAGYETPDKYSPEYYSTIDPNGDFLIGDKDDIKITTVGGLKYRGGINNKNYTYVNGNLRNSNSIRKTKDNKKCPDGYTDNTNFGLNEYWYNDCNYILENKKIEFNLDIDSTYSNIDFELMNLTKDLIKSQSGNNYFFYDIADITFIGNASAAKTQAVTNKKLARSRAENSEYFFNKLFVPILRAAGINTIFNTKTHSLNDLEDIEKKIKEEEEGNPIDDSKFCQECDQPDKLACKVTRRVDIYVRAYDEDTNKGIIAPSGDTTIEDKEGNNDLTADDDQVNEFGDRIIDIPPLDPEILKKLVYSECDFFKYLEINEPVAYQTISEKIKYFWAAYHSITPQGLNSRLTFLQQCLRQGDSVGRDGIENWKNLAFGRPPVCILRIGDFYHTRIIIKSLDINYANGMTWDLNPEGIGVQPMFVDVSMSVEIIGGSSMTAPINRLQNALSFNYYANTEMYDARADSVVFADQQDSQGNSDENATFGKLKSGKIIDGIRLSTITNFSKSQEQQRLATLRKQSRVALPNSTTASNSENLGQVGSLLEVKKRMGLALTPTEKTTLKIDDSVKKQFKDSEISLVTQAKISKVINTNVNKYNSILKMRVVQYNETGKESDKELAINVITTLFEEENLSNEDKNKILIAYQEALKNTK